MTFPALVYVMCLITSLACAALLWRAFRRTGAPLLLWSAMSFALLALNNALVVADVIFFPATDLILWRHLAALAAVGVLIYGFIGEAE
jgi:hypothetical protein